MGEISEEVESQPAQKVRMDYQALWHSRFGALPPKNLSLEFMEAIFAYESQCEANGGLSKATRRALEKAAESKKQKKDLSPGSTLVREWNGVPHRVEVVDGGYVYNAKVYSSLTAIAEEITGTHWSGPRFFGLKRKGRGA